MNITYTPNKVPLKDESNLFTLVENRTAYTFDRCELNIFETHQKAESVKLKFNDFVFTSMLRGKKIMHLKDQTPFEYLPGESVIVGPNELMEIDFPMANQESPTQCIALAISDEVINLTLNMLNQRYPRGSGQGIDWKINQNIHHIHNSEGLINTINRILSISSNKTEQNKDLYVDLAIQEMLLRIMQTQARRIFEEELNQHTTKDPLAYTIDIIKNSINERIDINGLAKAAGMSRAKYFQQFKITVGYTPAQFILKERLVYAKKLLRKTSLSVSQIATEAGFDNVSYFSRVFKAQEGCTALSFRKKYLN